MTLRLSLMAACVVFGLASRDLSAQRETRDPGIPGGYSPTAWAAKVPLVAGFYRLPGVPTEFKLGPQDQLEVFITGFSVKSVSVKVSNKGEISIPLLGTMNVNNLTTPELEERIATSLKEKGLLEKPEVLVAIAEHASKPIYIIGEVDNPGQYMMSHQLTLMEAVFLAGGIDFTAGRFGYLHRRVSEDDTVAPPPNALLEKPERPLPGTTMTRVDLLPLQSGGVLDPDIPLRRGDVLVVPRRTVEMYYVIGDVGKAGAYEIPEQRSMRISQALAYTGGPTRTAKASKGVLIRTDANGIRTEQRIDFNAIMQGKKEDFDVQPNDVIFVPGAQFKSVATGMLGIVPTVIQTALIF